MQVLSPVNDAGDVVPRSNLDAKAELAGPTFTGDVNLDRYRLINPNLGPYSERLVALGVSGTLSLDLSLANHFLITTPTGAITLNITNPPAARAGSRTLSITLGIQMGATLQAITWPAGVDWGAGGVPALAANATTWVTFWTHEATPTTWYAMVSWQSA